MRCGFGWLVTVLLLGGGCAYSVEGSSPSDKAGTDPSDPGPSDYEEPMPTDGADGDGEPDLPECADGSRFASPLTMMAPAPLDMLESDLGRPVDAHFKPLTGAAGKSVFQGDPPIRSGRVDTMEHRYVTVTNSRQMEAEARFWVVSGGVGFTNSQRYAAYHATQTEEIRKVDDTYDFREDLPEAAKYYVHAIHYGHSFDVLMRGSASSFSAGVRVSFLSAGGSISTFAESHSLSVTAKGRGLQPRSGDAIFARTADEIAAAYTASGPPVPIFVEYRSIPYACMPEAERFGWIPPIRVTVNLERMRTSHADSNDYWNVQARCRVDGSDVLISDPWVMQNEQDVTTNVDYTLGWSHTFDVLPGQNIRCGTSGEATEHWRGFFSSGVDTDSIPYGEFSYDVQEVNVDSDPSALPFFEAATSEINYQVFYSLRFDELDVGI